MNDSASALALAVFLLASFSALFLALNGLFPRMVEAAQRGAERMPGSAFALGLVNVLFPILLAVAISALAEAVGLALLQIPAILILAALVIVSLFGLSALSRLLGARLYPERNASEQITRGALILVLACLTPFVGWFLLLPYVVFRGVGGWVIGLFLGVDHSQPEGA